MDKFVRLTATACPLSLPNLNTDQILPARYLKWPRSKGLGTVLFDDVRLDAKGQPRDDFAFNKDAYRGAKVLLAGRNFGGGSSREAAVYALYDHGFRCVVAPSFGDIFSQNAVKNGLLTAVAEEADIEMLAALVREKPSQPVTVDLERQTVSGNGVSFAFMKRKARDRTGSEDNWKELFKPLPFGRGASAEEIGAAIAFIASEQSGYTSGSVVTIDAGLSARAQAF